MSERTDIAVKIVAAGKAIEKFKAAIVKVGEALRNFQEQDDESLAFNAFVKDGGDPDFIWAIEDALGVTHG